MRADIAVNFASAIWQAILTLVFTPVYVRYLGIEAFGLVGLLAALQATLGLLDFGLGQVLAREAARHQGGEIGAKPLRDLIRSAEIVVVIVAVVVFLAIALPSDWIAQSWLKTESGAADLVGPIKLMAVLV